MIAAALALVLAATGETPFTDPEQRYHLSLPAGWSFAPQPGDLGGGAFRRADDGLVAHCAVRVIHVGRGLELAAVVKGLGDATAGSAGYRLLGEDIDVLGTLPAVRRRFVVGIDPTGKDTRQKMVEQRVALVDGIAYVVHVETLAEAFASFEADFNGLFGGFAPRVRVAPTCTVCGGWALEADPKVRLVLREDGVFDLAGVPGRYRVDADRLELSPSRGAVETFVFQIETAGGGRALVLSGAALDAPVRYRELGATPSDGGMLPAESLLGTWRGETSRLTLGRNGRAMLDGVAGSWRLEGPKLVLSLGKGKRRVEAAVRIEADVLVLSGGRFGAGTRLARE